MSDWEELEAAAGRRTEEGAEEDREEESEAWESEAGMFVPRRDGACIRRGDARV